MPAHKRQLQKSRRLWRKPRRYKLVIQQVRNDFNLRKEGFLFWMLAKGFLVFMVYCNAYPQLATYTWQKHIYLSLFLW